MNRTSVLVGLVCAALAAACSSETKVGSTATALEFCKTIGGIAIEKEGLCLSLAPALLDSAKAQVDAGCSQMQAAVDAGRAVYDRAKGASCALALASRDACTALAHLQGDLPADCTTALTGAVSPGGACSSQGTECAGGYCTAFTPSCGEPVLSGQCVAWPAEGEPCPANICAPGLACSEGVCVALSGVGGPCPCQARHYCDTTGATFTCKALKTSGFCRGGFECAPGYTCSGFPGSCVPFVGLGASCGATAECGFGYYCDSGTGTCSPLPALGQTCVLTRAGTTAELWCVTGWCDAAGTKICQPRKADGEPCTSYDQCMGFCDGATLTCAGQIVCMP